MPILRRHDRKGAVLLEALLALTILATVGSAAAWMASEAIRTVARVHNEENRIRSAARLLTAVSLWPREDLDRHLGWRTQGPWRMRIDRPHSRLYEVSLADGATGKVLLRTNLYRENLDR